MNFPLACCRSSHSGPTLHSAAAPIDADGDGMPDAWELSHGLNPRNAADRNGHDRDAAYTNLEIYLHQLASAH